MEDYIELRKNELRLKYFKGYAKMVLNDHITAKEAKEKIAELEKLFRNSTSESEKEKYRGKLNVYKEFFNIGFGV